MNCVAGMPYVGLGLVDRMSCPRQARGNRHARAMEANMVRQAKAFEKLVPFLGRVFRKFNKGFPFSLLRFLDERQQVIVNRCGVDSSALDVKRDGLRFQIDVAHRHGGFGEAAALAHGNQPTVAHPLLLVCQTLLDGLLVLCRDFVFEWCGLLSEAESHARVRVDEAASYGFLQDHRKQFKFLQCSVVGAPLIDLTGGFVRKFTYSMQVW